MNATTDVLDVRRARDLPSDCFDTARAVATSANEISQWHDLFIAEAKVEPSSAPNSPSRAGQPGS